MIQMKINPKIISIIMKRTFLPSLIALLCAVVTFLTPPAFASPAIIMNNAAGGITGWALPSVVCPRSSISPVIVSNYTSSPQTGSITINPDLSQEVEVFDSATAASNSPYGSCDDPPFGQSKAFTSDFIVQPGETNVYYLAMGGTLNTLVSANNEHNIAIGGLPNGASNPKWYDFNLNLAESTDFTSLNLSYNNTGGTSSSNGQNGFNVVAIEKGVATQNILSPYSSTYAGGNVVWSANQPIGLAWLP
jgi:hypothetical protein